MVRRTWLAVLVTVIVCASFAAHAVAALVDAHLDTAHVPAPLVRHVESAPPARMKLDGAELVARNMFCSTCSPEPGPTSLSPDVFVPDAYLIATSIGRDPYATILVPATSVQGSFGVGDTVPGVGTITHVGFINVEVTDAIGRTGTLSLLPRTAGGRSERDAATSAPAAADPFAGRVRRIDDTTYEVERSLVRDLVGGGVKTGGARVVPQATDGKLEGLRLVGVRPGSPAAALGLQSRDLLQAINGTKIESANTLLGFYAELESLSTVELAGTRNGQPLTLLLRLR
jgi:hypothetical protein